MIRKVVLALTVLPALTAPVAAQVHIARPVREEAVTQLAQPRPSADWQLVNLLAEPVVLPATECSDYMNGPAWVSAAVDTRGAGSVVVQVTAEAPLNLYAQCLLQTRLGPDWQNVANVWALSPHSTGGGLLGVLVDGFSPSGNVGVGIETRVRCMPTCGAQEPVTMTSLYMLVKR